MLVPLPPFRPCSITPIERLHVCQARAFPRSAFPLFFDTAGTANSQGADANLVEVAWYRMPDYSLPIFVFRRRDRARPIWLRLWSRHRKTKNKKRARPRYYRQTTSTRFVGTCRNSLVPANGAAHCPGLPSRVWCLARCGGSWGVRFSRIAGVREDPREFQTDQGEQDQQINPQGPEGKPDRRCRLNARHGLSSGWQFDSGVFHEVFVANYTEQAVVRVHHRQHAKLVFGKHFGEVLPQGVPVGGDYGRNH